MNRRIEEDVMKIRLPAVFLFTSCLLLFTSHLSAQDLGPQFKKIKDGIFVYAGKPNESNCTIILTQEGVVLIDSGNTPLDSQAVMKAVKQLTSLPLRSHIARQPITDRPHRHFVFT